MNDPIFRRIFYSTECFPKSFFFSSDLSDQSPDDTDVITQENSTDITTFLFPAIGALLMLVFGGLLFSSGTVLGKTKTMPDKKYKRKFEQQYGRRMIRFHNIPDKIAKEPSSVLQQENNDIVDAVKKQYQDLPQYQPVSGLVGNIAGLHGQTCTVNICRPEVKDRGISPIHSATNECTSDYEHPSYKDKESDTEHEINVKTKDGLSIALQDNYFVGKEDHAERNPTASSGIGTNSPGSYEIDSLEEFPTSENDSVDLAETELPELCRKGFSIGSNRPLSVPAFDRGVYSGGRLSVLELESVPSSFCVKGCNCSIHGTKNENVEAKMDSTRTNNERLTWGDIALTGNLVGGKGSDVDKTRRDVLRFSTPSAEISGPLTSENMREINQSPLRRMDLEKWLQDVEESRKTNVKVYDQTLEFPDAKTEKLRKDYLSSRGIGSVSGRRRMRAPLQESLQLLKKLQLVSDDDLSLKQDPVHCGGRASCLNTVRAPSSLCLCGGNYAAHCQNEITSDQPVAPENIIQDVAKTDESSEIEKINYQLALTRTERVAKGGRQSSLNLIRASSGMCIHGPSCRFHCQNVKNLESVTESGIQQERSEKFTHQQELHSELKELRGASVFGELQDSPKINSTNDQKIGNSVVEQSDLMKAEGSENEPRGASTFGDAHSARNEITALNTRGASSFAEQPRKQLMANYSHVKDANSTQSYLGEIRGASCFAPLDESIAGTSSVTLSFAVESDTESFLAEKSLPERKRTDERKQNSKRFDERILKVGKDTTMMCTLLNALRRDGEQKRKEVETPNHNIIHRVNKENVTSGKEASVGSLKFSVLYKGAESATPLLYVTILGLEGILNERVTPGHAVYVKVCLFPKFTTWRRTRTLNVSEKLVFKDHFIISGVTPVDLEEAILRFVIVCVEDERVIGELEVPLEELKSRDNLKRTCALHAPCAMDDGTAESERKMSNLS